MPHSPSRSPRWLVYSATLLTFIGVVAWLYLPNILFSGPQGIHFIRQTDSISFMMNYVHGTWNFFTPAVFDLRNAPVDGKAAAEFPILYYLLALLRSGFGLSYTAIRSVDLAIVLAGHVLLARLASRWLGSILAGIGFSLWMFSSSVVIYYAANYLPDAPAYGCVLAGTCLVVEARSEGGRTILERVGVMLLVLAGLLKAPVTMYLLAYAGMVLFIDGIARWKKLLAIFTGVALIAAWNIYAIWYNAANQTHYFMTWAEPIWEMSGVEVKSTTILVTEYWWTKYHHPTSWHIMTLVFITALLLFRRIPGTIRLMLSFLLIAAIAYIALFFRKFADHDYYFLTLAPLLVFLTLAGLSALRDRFPSIRMTRVLAIAMVALAVMGLLLGKLNLERRYADRSDPHLTSISLEGNIATVLRENAIPDSSRFIVLGDPTPNGSLLFLNRKGWTYDKRTGRIPPLDSLISQGAEYLVVIGPTDRNWAEFDMLDHTAQWSLFRLNDEFR
ncbi:MAG: hypothetical protein KF843_10050 [Flavobacteriales bacterium]|nr:hypothetical protein [Flavobacteriales bacterium]